VAAALRTQLDEREAYAIALAMELSNVLIILDDKSTPYRSAIGLKVVGTVGLFLRAKNKGVIAKVEPLLTSLQQIGFHMTDALRQEALRLSGEHNPSSTF